jgi:ubiquitin-conjugating enzyme E2 variant
LEPSWITRHDFIETNGDNFLISVPVLVFLRLTDPPTSIKAFLYLFALFVALTNQVPSLQLTVFISRFCTLLLYFHVS